MKPLQIGCICLVLLQTGCFAAWEVWENCSLVKDGYHDGDSFKVTKDGGSYEYILRLYYVDAPEIDASFPERVQEQADYWGISTDDVIRLGKEAKTFCENYLKKGFTVYTEKRKARGRSRKNRYYALIETENGLLGEALVAAGLARVFGVTTDMPKGLPRQRRYESALRSAEHHAKRSALGGWGAKKVEIPVSEGKSRLEPPRLTLPELPKKLSLQSGLSVYSTHPPHALIGRLTAGMEVFTVQQENATMTRIKFVTPEGRGYEALTKTDELQRETRF